MLLGRMAYTFLPEKALFGIKAIKFSKYFIWLDVISFIVQVAGAAMLTGTGPPTSTTRLGIHIYMGGIGMQQFFILCFLGMCIGFHKKLWAMAMQGNPVPGNVMRLLYALYASLAFITVSYIQPLRSPHTSRTDAAD